MRCVAVAVAVCLAAAVAGLGGGCVDQGPGPEPRKVDPSYVKEHLLAAEPAPIERLDVELGGKVVYLGNKVDKPRVAPGQAVTITHYWKVKEPVGGNWRVFTLLRAPAGSSDFMNLGASDMQFAYGPAKWKAGDIIEDSQTFVVRPDWRSAAATILVGLIEVGRHGTLDRMAATGPRTQDRAIIARTLEIDMSRAPPPPGTVHVQRAAGAITIDGSATDPGWVGVPSSPEFVTAEGSPEPVGKATAKMTWDDEYLYVFTSIADTDIYSAFKNQDDPLWKADCVELFVDADGNRRGYVELQVSPNNVTFDSWFAGARGTPGDEAWDSGMKTAVKVSGTGDVAGDGDKGWDAEIAIPWAALKGKDEAMAVRIPPQVGDRWRLNIVRVDRRSSGDSVSASSWNRITQRDFHALDRMLLVVFADQTGSIAPQPPVPPAPATAGSGAGSGAGSAAGSGAGSAAGSGSGSAAGSAALPSQPASQPTKVVPSATAPATTAPATTAPPRMQGSAAPVK